MQADVSNQHSILVSYIS